MQITITCPNALFTQRARKYFSAKNVECMICNNETELSIFNIDRSQADYLIHAFVKRFHLKRPSIHTAAA